MYSDFGVEKPKRSRHGRTPQYDASRTVIIGTTILCQKTMLLINLIMTQNS